MGYGDVFVAGVLGAILAGEGRSQAGGAVLVLVISIAWDALFLAVDTVPATVPVALALLALEGTRSLRDPAGGRRGLALRTAGAGE